MNSTQEKKPQGSGIFAFTKAEKSNIFTLSFILFFRMFSVFIILPVFNFYALNMDGATAALVGLAFGAYSLTQGLFQIPFGVLSDRFSRTGILLLAFLIFTAGSFWAAFATDIYSMIFARLLQGCGAISSIIHALIADSTRPRVRAGASALLGISVGIAFILAFGFSPLITAEVGLKGLFLIIGAAAVVSMLLVLWKIPFRQKSIPEFSLRKVAETFTSMKLYPVYAAALLNGTAMTVFLFQTQFLLSNIGYEGGSLWKIYFPVLAVSLPFMMVTVRFAQKKNMYRQAMLVGALILALSILVSVYMFATGPSLTLIILSLALFFCGFNVFEPVMPSLLTIKCDQKLKGTATGVYNFYLFIGNSIGAGLSGYFIETEPLITMYFMLAVLGIFFFFWRKVTNPTEQELEAKK